MGRLTLVFSGAELLKERWQLAVKFTQTMEDHQPIRHSLGDVGSPLTSDGGFPSPSPLALAQPKQRHPR